METAISERLVVRVLHRILSSANVAKQKFPVNHMQVFLFVVVPMVRSSAEVAEHI